MKKLPKEINISSLTIYEEAHKLTFFSKLDVVEQAQLVDFVCAAIQKTLDTEKMRGLFDTLKEVAQSANKKQRELSGNNEEDNCRCDKPFYISFGQSHAHAVNGVTFDKDSICQIDAPTREIARERAFESFGPKWCFVYDTLPDMSYFPRGVIKL